MSTMELEIEGSPDGMTRKHKKHKKKHKHRRELEVGTSSPKTAIKLKLKIGRETMGTKNVMSIVQPGGQVNDADPAVIQPDSGSGSEPSDEEQWLAALEKGDLDGPYSQLSKKNPALLTTRQRALLHGSREEDQLLQLPSGYKSVELTEEQKRRRQEKAKRRREQANEKMEKDKTETVDKLLKKQEAKNKRAGGGKVGRGGGRRSAVPRVLYRLAAGGPSLSLPPCLAFPMEAQPPRAYPEAALCGVCGLVPRTSVCSRTHVPVCGLRCYKQNLLAHAASSDPVSQVPAKSISALTPATASIPVDVT